MATENGEIKFDIKVVGDKFHAAVNEDDDVNLVNYLESYEELNSFFLLMGTIFGFISNDVKEKMDLLYDLLKTQNDSKNLSSVKRMIEYEKHNELLNKKGYISGSRTLLRLHRGLDFIQVFLKKIGELEDTASTAGACRDAYDLTLAKYHPFIIKNIARIAIYSLPTKNVLLKRVCGDEDSIKRAIEHLPQTLQNTSIVYHRIEELYSKYDLHNLD